MQTTLLGLGIAIIVALVAALLAPLVVDWNHFRSAFETEASRLIGMSVRVDGAIDARILPSPRIKLSNVEVGAAGGEPQLRAGAIELEVRLGPLLRGNLQASEVHLVAPRISLGLDRNGAVAWPAQSPSLRPEELSISRLSIEDGSISLADAASGKSLQMRKLSFDGDIRSLSGPFQGAGAFTVDGEPYAYRVSGSRPDGDTGLKIRLGIDPTNEPLTTDVDGVLSFAAGVPQFDGALALARPVGAALSSGQRVMSDPWHLTGAIRATPAAASLQNLSFQYGPDERAIIVTGNAAAAFGEHPHFDGTLKALEVDVDRALAAPDVTDRPPLLIIKSFAEAFVAEATLPLPGEVSVGIDGLTIGGTSIGYLQGTVRFDDSGWSLDDFKARAPGLTDVNLSGRLTRAGQAFAFNGPAALQSVDVDSLLAWLGGRNDRRAAAIGPLVAGPLSANGDITIAGDRLAVDRLTATLDRESVAGRLAYTWPAPDRPAVVDADLHATTLDLDALTEFAAAAVDRNGIALPRAGALALDIGKATLGGVDAQAIRAQVKFDAGALQIDRLTIGDLGGAALDVSGRIDELSSQPRGRLTVDIDAAALAGLADLAERLAPQAAALLRRADDRLAPAKIHGTLAVDRAPAAGSTAKFDLNGQLGLLRLALRGEATGDSSRIGDATVRIDGRLDADDGTTLVALLGLDHVLAVDALPGTVTLSAAGPLSGDLRVDGQIAASGFDAALRGVLHPGGEVGPTAAFQVLASAGDLRPLQAAATGQPGVAVPVSARTAVSFSGAKLTLSEIDVAVGKSSWRGRLGVDLSSPLAVDGDISARDVDAAHAAALLLGLPSQPAGAGALWSNQPVGAGAFSAINGAVTFRLERAAVTSSLVASELAGVVRFGPSAIDFDSLDGSLAGGRVAGALAFRHDADGLVSHGHVTLADADAATILQLDKKTIDARLSFKLDADSIGQSPAAIVSALHGSGSVALADAHVSGLDPAAFAAAVRAADQSATTEPAKIQAAVSAALAAGSLTVAQGDATTTITGGKVGVANVTLQATDGSELALAGAFDLGSATIDARLTLSAPPPAHALITLRPELGVALRGPLAAPQRSLDISALSGWLALRAAELQTRRLESIQANGRREVLGHAPHPEFSIVRAAPAGGLIEAGMLLGVAASTPSGRSLDLLQPEAAPTTGILDPNRPRSTLPPVLPSVAAPPAAPRTAGPDKHAPLNLLGPQN